MWARGMVLAGALAFAPATKAQDVVGFFTAADYKATTSDEQVGYTTGLLDAVLWMLSLEDDSDSVDLIAVCIGDRSRIGVSIMYDDYLAQNQDKLEVSAAELFLLMIAEQCFPDEAPAAGGGDAGGLRRLGRP